MSRPVTSGNGTSMLTDPYAYHLPPVQCSGRLTFVKSPESYGWVEERDLPEDKYRALYNRLDRAKDATTAEGIRNVVLEEYAREVMDLDKVIEHLVEGRCRSVPADIVLCGVRFAIAKLGSKARAGIYGLSGNSVTDGRGRP